MLAWISIALAAFSLVSPWATEIRPAQLDASFGFQTVVCWLALIGVVAAAFLDLRRAVLGLALAAAAIAGWFVWAMWIVTTPAFTSLPFVWVGTDVIGSGWYVAATGFLVCGTDLVRRAYADHLEFGWEQWLFTAIPGFGLMRLGSWAAGLAYALVFIGFFYLGSTDSPDPLLFHEYGKNNGVPPPYGRAPEWILFGLAVGVWALSVFWTVRERKREGL